MSSNHYKKTGNVGMFDTEFNKQDLSNIGNLLEKILNVVDFEMF